MKRIAVIGLGQFGSQTAITLNQMGIDVLAIDSDAEAVDEIKDLVSHAVILDSEDEKAMRAANIDSVDSAVVAIGTNVQSSLLTTALLQKLNVHDIQVRAINALQENILRSMGITKVINIEKEMGIQFSRSMSSGRIGRYIEISDRHSLLETAVPEGIVGHTLKAVNLRSRFGINIVGIKTRNAEVTDDGEIKYSTTMTDIPDPEYPLKGDDILVIAGTDENLERFIESGSIDDANH